MLVSIRPLLLICFIILSLYVVAKKKPVRITKKVPPKHAPVVEAKPALSEAQPVAPPVGKKNWVIAATFKNESMILSSWIEHYIKEGVDHFYLIDNGSQDDYLPLIQRFPQQQMFTLIRDSSSPTMGLQNILMNQYLKSLIVKEAKWVLVIDIDEYVYAADNTTCIGNVLDALSPNINRIWMPWKVFGSSGHLVQPEEGIVAGFTRRKHIADHHWYRHNLGYGKSFARATECLNLEAHYSSNGDPAVYHTNGLPLAVGTHLVNVSLSEEIVTGQPIQMNHYMFQSRDYYQRVKSVRGGGQSGRTFKYTMEFFDQNEPHFNQVVDTALKTRREDIGERCMSRFAAVPTVAPTPPAEVVKF